MGTVFMHDKKLGAGRVWGKAELYPDIAPISVNNFISLIQKNFYDGLIFHRVIKGFMIQGGDPEGYDVSIRKRNV